MRSAIASALIICAASAPSQGPLPSEKGQVQSSEDVAAQVLEMLPRIQSVGLDSISEVLAYRSEVANLLPEHLAAEGKRQLRRLQAPSTPTKSPTTLPTVQNPWCNWNPAASTCGADDTAFTAKAMSLASNSLIKAFVVAEASCENFTIMSSCVAGPAGSCSWTGSYCQTTSGPAFSTAAISAVFQENAANCGWAGNLLSAPYCSAFSLQQCHSVLGCTIAAQNISQKGVCTRSQVCKTDPAYATSLICGRQLTGAEQVSLNLCSKQLTLNATVAAMGGGSATYDSTCFNGICPAYGQWMMSLVPATVGCSVLNTPGTCGSDPVCLWSPSASTPCGVKVSAVWASGIPNSCPIKPMYSQSLACQAEATAPSCSDLAPAGGCSWQTTTACLQGASAPVSSQSCDVSPLWVGQFFTSVGRSPDTQLLAAMLTSESVCSTFNSRQCQQFDPSPYLGPQIANSSTKQVGMASGAAETSLKTLVMLLAAELYRACL